MLPCSPPRCLYLLGFGTIEVSVDFRAAVGATSDFGATYYRRDLMADAADLGLEGNVNDKLIARPEPGIAPATWTDVLVEIWSGYGMAGVDAETALGRLLCQMSQTRAWHTCGLRFTHLQQIRLRTGRDADDVRSVIAPSAGTFGESCKSTSRRPHEGPRACWNLPFPRGQGTRLRSIFSKLF